MAVNIVVPSFGESITEGTVAQWLKQEGEAVQKDDILLEVESEKATQEIPSPAAGVLHIQAKQGDHVEVGGVLGSIDENEGRGTKGEGREASSEKREAPVAPPAPSPPAEKEIKLSPAARRAAAEEKIDPSKIQGTGRHGVIRKEDVVQREQEAKAGVRPAHAGGDSALAPRPSPLAPPEKRVPMTAIRQRIAERLLTSQKATASLTTFNEVDMSAVLEVRARYKDNFKETHGVGLGFMAFFVKASIEALKAFPLANAIIDGRDIVYHENYHIGVAVSTEKGLMVPVLRDAQAMSFAQIEQAIGKAAAKARDGKIGADDLVGGTFTITNGGIFGSMMSTPILNFPQAAILGMHAIQKRPVVRDDQIVIRPMMYVALTYDHRLLDGREAVLFLVRIKECIEDPQRLLLEI